MGIKALRESIQDHPAGVTIRMIGGTEYRLPHGDYMCFTPTTSGSQGRYATSFWLHDPEKNETRLINAMLVKEVAPLHRKAGPIDPDSPASRN